MKQINVSKYYYEYNHTHDFYETDHYVTHKKQTWWYGDLPFPGTGCPIPDVGNINLIWND